MLPACSEIPQHVRSSGEQVDGMRWRRHVLLRAEITQPDGTKGADWHTVVLDELGSWCTLMHFSTTLLEHLFVAYPTKPLRTAAMMAILSSSLQCLSR
eukprot:1679811-Amphidinium_carterae.1